MTCVSREGLAGVLVSWNFLDRVFGQSHGKEEWVAEEKASQIVVSIRLVKLVVRRASPSLPHPPWGSPMPWY